MTGPVLVLEFNELCPPLMERFIEEGSLPNFRRLRDESFVYITEAGEGPGRLNPWVQWVTVHTGLPLDEHGALRLGDGRRVAQPTIGDVASAAGRRVWLCGPMNVVPRGEVCGVYLPDPWAADARPQPPELEPFHRFVQASVQEHSNPSARLSARNAAAFVWFVLRHGLRLSTVTAVARQLAAERRHRVRWRRAALLDRFQWDVFRHYYRREEPDLATFFSNSTAHLQHHYWRYMEPAAFDEPSAEADLTDYGHAIRDGYVQMDRLVGEAIDLAGKRGTVVLCTALSQQPFRKGEVAGKGAFHRPLDLTRFASVFGIDGVKDVAPVMAEQFHLLFENESAAEAARAQLARVRLDGEPVLFLRRDDADLFVGCARFGPVDPASRLTGFAGEPVPFGEVFYSSETGQSGMHHPDGMLWIRPPNGGTSRTGPPQRVALLDVGPTILELIDVRPPPKMPGHALAPVGAARDS